MTNMINSKAANKTTEAADKKAKEAAKKFNEKLANKQEENAYILYMMLGSLFHKCNCRNESMIGRLFLYYREMQERKQEDMELRVLQAAQKICGGRLDELELLACDAFIERKGNCLLLCFDTGFERLEAQVWPNGFFKMRLVQR